MLLFSIRVSVVLLSSLCGCHFHFCMVKLRTASAQGGRDVKYINIPLLNNLSFWDVLVFKTLHGEVLTKAHRWISWILL